MKVKFLALFFLPMWTFAAHGKTVYMSPEGNDSARGDMASPVATLPAAYERIGGGDTIVVRGGRYEVTDSQVMKTERGYAYVFALEKGGTAERRTCIMGYPGERPVFDFSALQMGGRLRFAGFYLGADYLHLKNFDIVGLPVRIKGHTQSECVAARKGSFCIVENLAMHDNMAIGYYQNAGEGNLVLNCDAYNNYDDFSEGAYGGNVDGFGCHIRTKKQGGNVLRGCRAWRNSDDGFDLINCDTAVELDHCYAFYNGFQPTENAADTLTFESAGDGNGFKAGGWGMGAQRTKCPEVCPTHYIHDCLALGNKANGLYANHHLGGNRWENNVAVRNRRDNYNMVNRRSTEANENVDVPGYGHWLKGNTSYRPGRGHLSNIDGEKSVAEDNSWQQDRRLTDGDFVATSQALLFAPRDADGNLPENGLYKLKR